MLTLGEIVSSALQNAADGVKVASLQDASLEDRSFQNVDEYLARELNQIQVETQSNKTAAQQTPPETSDLDDVSYALKLAQALEHGALVVQKLADGGQPTSGGAPKGGPVPLYPAPPNREGVISPKPQASAHARHAQANRSMENGHPETDKGIPTGGGPVVPPGGFGGGGSKRLGNAKTAGLSHEGTLRLLRTKQAQYSALVSLGQIEAAEGVLKEARILKRAADNMTNGTNGLIQGDSLSGTRFPDNEGVRNLTKAQARDATQRQAGNYFGEPVKKDNAVAAHALRTDGLKLSSAPGDQAFRDRLRKSAALMVRAAQAQREKEAGVLDAVGGAVAGAGTKALRQAAGGAFRAGMGRTANIANKGVNALSSMGPTGKKVLGGAVLGTSALGTAGLAHKALSDGGR